MAHMTLSEIETMRTTIAKREQTLPGYWGRPSDAVSLFDSAYEYACKLRESGRSEGLIKDAQQRAQAYARLSKQALEDAKKKPRQAFENFNVAAQLLDRELHRGWPVEQALQTAQRKTNCTIKAAREDKQHWLRKTATWDNVISASK